MRHLILAFLILGLAAPAFAAEGIVVGNASAYETKMVVPRIGVYMIITNNGPGADALLGVATPRGKATLNATDLDDKGQASLRPIDKIEIPKGESVALTQLSDNIVIGNVRTVMHVGEHFPMHLTFARAGKKEVSVEVVTATEMRRRFPPELMGENMKKLTELAKNNKAPGPASGADWQKKIQVLKADKPPVLAPEAQAAVSAAAAARAKAEANANAPAPAPVPAPAAQ
jgi:copper(I)-binding protein